MAVKLRLRRMGRKKWPFYRIVAADSRSPRDGRFIETLGVYDPLQKPHKIELKEERIIHWLQNGARPTDTVKSLFRRKGLWLRWDLMRRGADEKTIDEEYKKWEVLQLEREKRLAEKESAKTTQPKAEEAEEKSEPSPDESAETAEATDTPEEAVKSEDESENKNEEESKE